MEDHPIVVENLGKRFLAAGERRSFFGYHFGRPGEDGEAGSVWALRRVSFSVAPGEMLGIVGFNGAGKSTLLAVLAGILRPTEGQRRVRGRVNPLLGIGSALLAELSVEDNLRLCGAIFGFSASELRKSLEGILEFGELWPYRDRRLGELSSGFQMRVPFSVAMHVDSDIFLVDESLTLGDIAFQEKCKRAFELLKARGKTIVFATSDAGGVRSYCTRALYLVQGSIALLGDTEKVLRRYESDAKKRIEGSGQ